jgi:hypothetical protein
MDCNRSHTGILIPSPNKATQNPIPTPNRNRSVDSPDVRHASHSRRDHHAGQKQTAAKSRAQYMQRLCKELLTTRISSFQFPPLSVGLTLEPPQSLYAAG